MINTTALALIKASEGLRLTAYQDAVGVWTIGWGVTANAGVGIAPHAGMTITEAQAEGFLIAAVEKVQADVLHCLTRKPTSNQLGAMVSLTYNIGLGNFKKSSVLRFFNAGDDKMAAIAFGLWNKAGNPLRVLPGLVTRRAAEAKLYLTP